MKKYFLLPAFVAAAFPAMSQSIVFADDALGRGYVDRPYLRYEAEEGSVAAIGNVDFINADPYDQASLASEASNLQAAQLTAAGSYIEWKLDADADAHIRYHATRIRTWSDRDYDYTETQPTAAAHASAWRSDRGRKPSAR